MQAESFQIDDALLHAAAFHQQSRQLLRIDMLLHTQEGKALAQLFGTDMLPECKMHQAGLKTLQRIHDLRILQCEMHSLQKQDRTGIAVHFVLLL